MENYEQKYKEAIARAKDYCNGHRTDVSPKAMSEYLFPELKESEDEKIRKSLIGHLKECRNNTRSEVMLGEYAIWISWLEKQGEQKPQGKLALEVWKDMRLEVYQQASGNRHEPNYSDDSTKMFSLTDIDEIFEKVVEKQGKQKSTDKVEPKFKVGDWVRAISSGNIFKILSVNDGLYRVLCYDGVEANYPIEDVEKDLSYWTIQDAKDGDVLCGYPTDDYPWIGIFHELNDDYTFKSYCYLQAGITGKFCPPSGVNIFNRRNVDGHNSEFIVPATKEQRDILFQKMKEAGYEWDTEKKELKKIEQDSAWSEEDGNIEKISEYTTVEKDMDEYNKGFECGKQRVLKYPEDFNLCEKSASAWSEEDVNRFRNLIYLVENSEEGNGTKRGFIKFINRLKSLKGGVQPKQEWSENDEKMFSGLNSIVEGWYNTMSEKEKEYYGDCGYIDWLKSIKERIHPQSEWNEEDKGNLLDVKCVIDEVWHNQDVREEIGLSDEELELLWHWLDNIWQRVEYPQNRWKPTEEQMRALNAINLLGELSYVGQGDLLVKLYQDLKNL